MVIYIGDIFQHFKISVFHTLYKYKSHDIITENMSHLANSKEKSICQKYAKYMFRFFLSK